MRMSIRLWRLVFERDGEDWDVFWYGPTHTYMLHPWFARMERENW